ncbi:hypothetical protein VCHENC02_3384A, partial [Vibrio harveyi]
METQRTSFESVDRASYYENTPCSSR